MTDRVAAVLAARSFEDVFTSLAELKHQYRDWAMAVHPDRGGSDDALAKLTALREQAEQQAPGMGWVARGKLSFACTDGKTRNVRYRHHHAAGPTEAYQATGFVTYVFPNEHADLAEAATRAMKSFRYPSPDWERRLTTAGAPQHISTFHAQDVPLVGLVVGAKPEMVRLDHLLAHQGGALPATHVAWVMTRLMNLCCWLSWQRKVHHDISPEHLYVDPATHELWLLGGWWHQRDEGHQMPLQLPGTTVAELPRAVRETKVATGQTDLRLARRVARTLLGDAAGTRLRGRPDVPAPFARWLVEPPAKNAFKDFEDWEKVRESSFGERRFVKLEVTAADVYPTTSTAEG